MEAKIKELLEATGIRPESALERFMGNEGIYQKFAWKFLDDRNYGALLKAVEEGDAKAAFTAAHTLKGLCGNLSFDRLCGCASEVVEPLRAGDFETAKGKLPELAEAYQETVKAVKAWKEG